MDTVKFMRKKLLFSVTKKDLKIDYFSGTGAGGQHRNKHQNCVRMRHIESGGFATGQSHRERQSNLREAFNSLVKHPKFKIWMNRKTYEVLDGKKIEDKVEEQMADAFLKVEFKDDKNKWVEGEQNENI